MRIKGKKDNCKIAKNTNKIRGNKIAPGFFM